MAEAHKDTGPLKVAEQNRMHMMDSNRIAPRITEVRAREIDAVLGTCHEPDHRFAQARGRFVEDRKPLAGWGLSGQVSDAH